KTFAGDGAEELIRRCLRAGGDGTCSKFEEMQRLYRRYFGENCMYRVRLYDGIFHLLETMKQKEMKIAVLSNKPHAQAADVVEKLFGTGYFDYVQGQTGEIPRKPSPEGALRIAEYFGVERSECLYIGDTDTDMQTGKDAGMFTIGVLWGFRSREELEENRADWIVGHPSEIESFLRRRCKCVGKGEV
ncbi:MAG: HAD family hydrolase, partial [Lachnospiraceae bacterium]|nr:HAD family hydrolase [Lachnospiraceae bacterium]